MGFLTGDRVEVKKDGPAWYGEVHEKLDSDLAETQYRVRVGGTNTLVEVPEGALLLTHRFGRPGTSRHTLKTAIDAHKIILLGCTRHGLTCAETLVGLYRSCGSHMRYKQLGTIFVEGFFFHETDGVDASRCKFAGDREVLTALRSIAARVIGLESDRTVGEHSSSSTAASSSSSASSSHLIGVKQAEKFGHDQRNTVANEVWGKLILAQMLNGRPTVVCCGAAHLVRAMESGSVAPPLPAYLHALQARIVVLAVANSENDQYIPAGTGTNDSLPCIEPIPEDGEEDEDD